MAAPELDARPGRRKYKARSGAWQYKPAFSELARASRDGTIGFCLACGREVDNVEPDARRVTCGGCEQPKVFGADELLIMGLFYDDGKR